MSRKMTSKSPILPKAKIEAVCHALERAEAAVAAQPRSLKQLRLCCELKQLQLQAIRIKNRFHPPRSLQQSIATTLRKAWAKPVTTQADHSTCQPS
jgi:hypothetical protein